MTTSPLRLGRLLALVLFWQLALVAGPGSPVAAATPEDVALFYDELAQYGAWVSYGKYGQVWYPTKVSENWRPYVDGRWLPSDDGWIFETDEPWGWATYHFGNWMPTEEYGWVWTPGSTWYPATAAWRSNDDYFGWAPVPPPDYVPAAAYAPVGYYSGMPFLDLISPPFWNFVPASSFLLGFGLPFSPFHTFHNCGCLAPFNFLPSLFPRTRFIDNFFFPPFAPNAFFFFGPPFQHVARAAKIDIIKINNFAGTVKINNFHNAVPPPGVLTKRPFLKEAVPAAVWEGRRLEVRQAPNARLAERNLNRPDVMRSARPISAPVREAPEVIRGLHRERSGPTAEIGRGLQPERPTLAPEVVRGGRRGPPAPGSEVGRLPRAERPALTPEVVRGVRRGSAAPAPEVMRGRGMRLPPQSVEEPRVMQQQMRGQRQLERQTLPRAQQQRLLREEQLIRRQEVFRPQSGPRQEAVRPRSGPRQEVVRPPSAGTPGVRPPSAGPPRVQTPSSGGPGRGGGPQGGMGPRR